MACWDGMAGAAAGAARVGPAGFHSGAFALSLNSLAPGLNLNGFFAVAVSALGFSAACRARATTDDGGKRGETMSGHTSNSETGARA